MTQQLSYVSLFSSAGLGCYGIKLEGFECVATAELLPRRLEVQKANEIAASAEGYALGDLSDEAVRRRLTDHVSSWKADRGVADITLLVATPPCQGMSVANHKKTKNEIVRNSLVVESIKLIAQIRPQFFILENVRSFLRSQCVDVDGVAKPIGEAIDSNLANQYNIFSTVINFKDRGGPSSRTRSLVFGVRRDQRDIAPNELLPNLASAPTLRELIGDLPRLTAMGEISENDIYHAFRSYEERMRSWIAPLKEGQSAFDNVAPDLQPHRIIDGEMIRNKASNGDKYRRNLWDKVAPCVHTRNDILASQSTIHPEDDRVFSIRELSRMMGVDSSFRWGPFDLGELNSLPIEEKRAYLREHETNIRQCLGEGVPTPIFRSIAASIKAYLVASESPSARTFVGKNIRAIELANDRRTADAAFYTRQDIAFQLVSTLPAFAPRKPIRVLEPSVGAGAFLPALLEKYRGHEIYLDLVDINAESLGYAREIARMGSHEAVHIRYFNVDFFDFEVDCRYDIVLGNPPFGKTPVDETRAWQPTYASKDLFARFLERAVELADHVAFVIPKTFLSGPEHSELREKLSARSILHVCDYGEGAFADIKIETIGLHVGAADDRGDVVIDSLILGEQRRLPQEYVVDPMFPAWLIYRDEEFDRVAQKLELGTFVSVRDRQLSARFYAPDGDMPVVRSRDISRSSSSPIVASAKLAPGQLVPAAAKSYFGKRGAFVVPNLSYYPRGRILPDGHLVDGSAAVLYPRDQSRELCDADLDFFSSDVFFWFYRVARNYSTRTLNIDSVSTHFWGMPVSPARWHTILISSRTPVFYFTARRRSLGLRR